MASWNSSHTGSFSFRSTLFFSNRVSFLNFSSLPKTECFKKNPGPVPPIQTWGLPLPASEHLQTAWQIMLGQPLPVSDKQWHPAPSPHYLDAVALALPQDSMGTRAHTGTSREPGSIEVTWGRQENLVTPLSYECPLGVARRQRARTNSSMSWPLPVVTVFTSSLGFELRQLGGCKWIP